MGDRILLTIPRAVQFGAGKAGARLMAAMIDEHLLSRLDRSDRVWLSEHLRASKLPVAPGKPRQPLTWPYAEFGPGPGQDSILLATLIRARRASYEAACAKSDDDKETIATWVREHGGDVIGDRYKSGLATPDEIAEVRAGLMLPNMPWFSKIEDAEFKHGRCLRGRALRMSAMRLPGDPLDVLGTSPHLFDHKQADYVRALSAVLSELPDVEVYLRAHKASCTGCTNLLTRIGMMAKLSWAGTTVRREYALPKGDIRHEQ